jgi:hypothetical protein
MVKAHKVSFGGDYVKPGTKAEDKGLRKSPKHARKKIMNPKAAPMSKKVKFGLGEIGHEINEAIGEENARGLKNLLFEGLHHLGQHFLNKSPHKKEINAAAAATQRARIHARTIARRLGTYVNFGKGLVKPNDAQEAFMERARANRKRKDKGKDTCGKGKIWSDIGCVRDRRRKVGKKK